MHRDEHEEKDNHSSQSVGGKEHGIEYPRATSPPDVAERPHRHNRRQQPGHEEGGEVEGGHTGTGRDFGVVEHLGTAHQRHGGRVGCELNLGPGEGLFQHFGSEHLFAVSHGAVQTATQGQVDAEDEPGATLGVAVDLLAEGGQLTLGFVVAHPIAEGRLDHVAGPGGAVVEEEVIAVDAVLGLGILQQGVEECLALLGREVENLLVDPRLAHHIVEQEGAEVVHTQAIVGLALGKPPHKGRGIEVEHAIVEHIVKSAGSQLPDPQGRMPEKLVHLGTGAAREQTHLQGVAVLDLGLYTHCQRGHQRSHE